MKKILFSLLLFAACSVVTAQKVFADENAEKRNVGSFHGVSVSTGIELVLTEANVEEVAVSAENTEFRDKIVTKVDNGILKIYYENKLSSMNNKKVKKRLKAWVSYKTLNQLYATTGAIVRIEGTLNGTMLEAKANTGAQIKGNINVDELTMKQGTGSIVTLSGNSAKLEVEGDTGSMFKGIDLKTNICDAKVSTGAEITVLADKELKARANTGGIVKYKGNAAIREITKNTGGIVSRM